MSPVGVVVYFLQVQVIARLVTEKNVKRLFFLRGLYPFYLLAVLAVALFFHLVIEPQEHAALRTAAFYWLLVLKTLISFILPFVNGKECQIV